MKAATTQPEWSTKSSTRRKGSRWPRRLAGRRPDEGIELTKVKIATGRKLTAQRRASPPLGTSLAAASVRVWRNRPVGCYRCSS